MTEPAGASITVHRLVGWHETDAAGHNHFAAAFRWVEEAEHALLRALGMTLEEIARIPRVHIEVDYRDRLYYGQPIAVVIRIRKVGSSSCTYDFEVRTQEGSVAVAGSLVMVHVSGTADGSQPWPEPLRAAMLSGRALELRSTLSDL